MRAASKMMALPCIVRAGLVGAGLFGAGALAASPAAGQSTLKLELNRLEAREDGCRVYMMVENPSGPALRSLKVDLFALDKDGVAAKRLAIELAPVQERKTVIRLFDFAGLPCPSLGRVLLNDVIACEGAVAPVENCLGGIVTSSRRGAVPFDQ